MFRSDHREILRVQADERADRKEAHQIHEALQQRLVERRIALLAHDAANAHGRKPLPVRTVAAQRIEDVRNRHDHRAQIQLPAPDILRVAAQVLAQMVLEGDDRGQRRHFRRPPQNVRAVDDVLLHDLELVFRELVGLIEHFERRLHFPDVVHQRGEAEFAQQRAVEVEGARLRHRKRRHVHHVRESADTFTMCVNV